uniref:Uncharacterized protein n=1 Tax=Setaria italica TaxID=4555 RepID=K3YKL4_SETIT
MLVNVLGLSFRLTREREWETGREPERCLLLASGNEEDQIGIVAAGGAWRLGSIWGSNKLAWESWSTTCSMVRR